MNRFIGLMPATSTTTAMVVMAGVGGIQEASYLHRFAYREAVGLSQVKAVSVPLAGLIKSTWGALWDKLNRIASLRHGWNSYDAPPPSPLTIEQARLFLECLHSENLEPGRLAASAIGGVGISLRSKQRRVYVEFRNDGGIYVVM